ncbi:MAG: DoxX family protein [Patescibacteria group bacterium]
MLSIFPDLLDYSHFAPFILRVILGLVFVVHGYPKLFTGFAQTAGWFDSVGIKPGKFWAFVVGATEFFGGIALIFGFATQLAALLIAIIMLAAIVKVKFKQGFAGGYEFDLMLLAAAVALMLMGAGAFAIDWPL